MRESVLHSYTAVARRLGVHRMTVSDLSRLLGLGLEVRSRLGGRLLTEADVRRIAKLLRIDQGATSEAS